MTRDCISKVSWRCFGDVIISSVSSGSGLKRYYFTGSVIGEKVLSNIGIGVGCSLDLLGRTHSRSGNLTFMG